MFNKRNYLLILFLTFLSPPCFAITGDSLFARFHPAIGENGMVSSPDNIASQVGVKILQDGGNAVDAAVATAFALSVTRQGSGGLGGGGFMMIHLAKQNKTIAINYREKAPLAAMPEMFLDKDQMVDREKISNSYLASGVPGTVAGLTYVQKAYGTLPLAKVMQPAIELAQNGFLVTNNFAQLLIEKQSAIQKWPATKAIYMPQGKLLAAGDILIQKDLANTLRLIAKQGAFAFYQGQIADVIAADMKKHGGIITLTDLADYKIQELKPLTTTYHDYQIAMMPLPSSGGVALAQILTLIKDYPLADWGLNSSKSIHVIAEALNKAFVDRNHYLGDPNFVKVPLKQLLDEQRLKQVPINSQQHTPANKLEMPAIRIEESSQTAHFSVVDKDRNLVANTQTLNDMLGSGIIVSGTGILLNNEMDDFTAKVGASNMFGVIDGAANAIQAKKQPLSSMTPTFVFDKKGNPVLVIGAAGGSRIISTILQIILNVLDYNLDIASAINSPRFHSQWLPDEIVIEQGFSQDTIEKLQQQGHRVEQKALPSVAQAIVVVDDKLYGAADSRNATGLAVGY